VVEEKEYQWLITLGNVRESKLFTILDDNILTVFYFFCVYNLSQYIPLLMAL